MEISMRENGYNYPLGKILLIRQFVGGVVKYLVAEGNHRVFSIKKIGWEDLEVIVIAAPDGMFH